MDASVLEKIGLSGGEIKVYLALLKLGSTKTGPLALNAGVSSSKVYKILARLEQKGLVGHVIKQGIKHYKTLETRKIIDYIDEKEGGLQERKRLVEKMLPELDRQRNIFSKPEATVYSGFKAVTSFFKNILEELKAGDEYFVIGARYSERSEMEKRFFYKFHQRRALKKIKLKMLASHDVRKDLVKTTRQNSELRFLPPHFLTQISIVFYKNKAFIVVWADEIAGFLIESKQVVKSFQTYFENFWKIAKK